MKKITPRGAVAAVMLVGSVAMAAAQTSPPPAEKMAPPADAPAAAPTAGTAPDHIGSTGWTGGTRGTTEKSGTAPASPADQEAAKNQPTMATGSDLKGEPKKFPASKTPE